MSQDHCYALALSGGGSNGAWEAGLLWGLTHYGNPDDFKWDIVTGISAGSINTSAMSVYAVGDEIAASEFISLAWASVTNADIWQEWSTGTPR